MEISLALGGGGAKGSAHIGVFKVLEREGFKIRGIAGTSIGGLIGAAYAAGNSSDQILEYFKDVDQTKLYGRQPDEQPALLGLAGVTQVLSDLVADLSFKDLSIPFAVTAVDLVTGCPQIIKQGSVKEAVLATIAVPGIFPARQRGDQLLIDGGIFYPVPTEIARSLCPRFPTVAVVLSRHSDNKVHLPVPNIPGPAPLISYLSRLRVAQALNVFLRSMDISGQLLTELRLDIDKPDVIIRPDLSGIGLLDRVDPVEVARRGEVAAEISLPNLKKVVRWQYRLSKAIGLPHIQEWLNKGINQG
ncbi:MAG: patatin-like phospholipase family protein [Anaerolineales bacterium]